MDEWDYSKGTKVAHGWKKDQGKQLYSVSLAKERQLWRKMDFPGIA